MTLNEKDNPFDALCALALHLPREDRYFRNPSNHLRSWLEDLADCVRAAATAHAERKADLMEGRPA